MKKFTSLFALLSCLCVVSAQAEDYVPSFNEGKTSVFFEAASSEYNYIYIYGGEGELAGAWPGTKFDENNQIGTVNGNPVYLWTYDGDHAGSKIIFHKDGSETNRYEADFAKNGYYKDGVLTQVIEDGGYTVYFYDSKSWGDDLRIYVWHKDYNVNNGWPGKPMTSLGNNLYSYEIKGKNFTNIIFNNGIGGGANQTSDLTAENDKVYVIDGTTNNAGSHNTFTVDASLTVTDGVKFPYNKDFAVLDANYTRSNVTSEWGTLCLPFGFNVSDQRLATQNVTFYSFSAVDPAARTIKFSPISNGEVSPGQAVLFKLSSPEGRLSIRANNGVSVTSAPQSGESVGLYGTFVEARKDNVYYISADQFYFGSNILIKPYRGIVENAQGPSEQSGGAPFRFTVDDTEDIQFVEQEDGTVKAYYDLQGRKLDGARKGLVIENGKIIMVK